MGIDLLFKIAAIGILVAVLHQVLVRAGREDQAMMTTLAGCIYVLGDNRDESLDSRTFGCIPLEKVEGKVILRYWPITQFGTVK